MTTPEEQAAAQANQPTTQDPGVMQDAAVADPNAVQQTDPVGNAPAGVDPSAITNPPTEESFEKRLADGTGGGDWHMTEDDRYINERYQQNLAAGHDETTAMNMARQDLEQKQATEAAANPDQVEIARQAAAQQQATGGAVPSGNEPQALSQPGPTNPAPDGA